MYSNLPGQKKSQPTFAIADLHCDTVVAMRRGYDIGTRHDSYHLDIPRMREGGVRIQVFAASSNLIEQEISSFDHVNSQLDLLQEQFACYPNQISICTNADEIKRAVDSGKIAAILAVEGGLALGSDISRVQHFYNRGVRIITISHEAPTGWCVNHKESNPGFHGLTDTGRDFIREMNRLGIIIDLSHSADSTVEETLKLSTAPVIASHSNARALCNHSR
jgi:membrane dipeptidase